MKEEGLTALFSGVGEVKSARIVIERETNRSKGFGFVEMGSDDLAARAIEEVNGKEIEGRQVRVSEAKPREDRPRGGGFGGGRGGDRGGDRGGRGGGFGRNRHD